MVDEGQHPVEYLFEGLKTVEPYPQGVDPVPERLPGTAFFPGVWACGIKIPRTHHHACPSGA